MLVVGEYSVGEAIGVPIIRPDPYVCSVCRIGNSSGNARDFIMRSRSSLLIRFSFALLRHVSHQSPVVQLRTMERTCFETILGLDEGLGQGSPWPTVPDELRQDALVLRTHS